MNQDDIIRMVREACPYTTDEMRGAFYEGFLKGAVAEREVCAKVADEWVKAYPHPSETIAAAIRARGGEREHDASSDCWCNPELNYVDPVTGAKVWVHKEPQ